MSKLTWLAALLFVLVSACGHGDAPAGSAAGGSAPAAQPSAEARYVGGASCRPCHAEIWSTFSRTGMGRSWSPMSEAPIVEDWTSHNAIEVPATGLRYRMTRRDGKFFMKQSIADGRGGETAIDERELAWVVGSSNHSRTYLISEGGKLFQAPVCWQTQEPVWDLCPGYEVDNRYFARDIGRTCVYCHNDRMQLLPGAHNEYAEPIPHGIGCERCHGPGGQHIAKWDRGATPTGQADPTIVNPKRLAPDLRMQVCFPCHLGDANFTERVSLYQASLEDWHPGLPITAAVVPFRYSQPTRYEFSLSAQVDRLLLSRCFRESGGKLECLTCHNPHKTVFRNDRPADFFTAQCTGCHKPSACTAKPAVRRATTPPDNCVVCHMRTAEPDDQHHVRFTDHWIRTRIDEPPAPRTRFELEPYFPEQLASLSPADRAFYTARAISLRARVAPKEARPGMWPQAEAKFREALAAGFTRAEGPYFLGITLTSEGKGREAAEAFAAAFAKDPGDYDIAFSYGGSLIKQNRIDEAERVFTTMAREHPESAGPPAQLAGVRISRNDYAGALVMYQKAIALDPWNAAIRVNAANMLSALSRHAEAIAEAEQALRLAPEAPSSWKAYATLLARAGRAPEANAAMRRAQQLAEAPPQRTTVARTM
jgi:Flp pilus assembly protein TadD